MSAIVLGGSLPEASRYAGLDNLTSSFGGGRVNLLPTADKIRRSVEMRGGACMGMSFRELHNDIM